MIGNDIVDLALARKENNWNREGFLNKIFTKREQLMILTAQNQEETVWNLWSRKEAAYKIYNRQTGIRAYIPLQLECFDLEVINQIVFGQVECYGVIYYTKTEVSKDSIYTIAATSIEHFQSIQNIENLSNIYKINGIPSWFDNKKSVELPVSISHHGRFTKMIRFN